MPLSWLPPVRDRSSTVLRPRPVSATIERVGKGSYFPVVSRIRVKIRARSQSTGEQNGAVHSRQFALPHAPAGLHVEKMIIEAVITRSVRLGALRAVPEKSQCGENCLDCRRARDEAALDGYRIHRQGEPSGGNAGRPIGRGLVEHQSILRISPVQKVSEGVALNRFQLGIDRRFVGVHGFTGVSNSDVDSSITAANAWDGNAASNLVSRRYPLRFTPRAPSTIACASSTMRSR